MRCRDRVVWWLVQRLDAGVESFSGYDTTDSMNVLIRQAGASANKD